MKKKIVIVSIFVALMLITAIVFLVSAIESYRYDMDPANGVDIMEGMGAAMLLVVGGFILLYELDLFYTVYYFFVKPKTKAKTILNIFSHLGILLVLFSLFTNVLREFLCKYVSDIFREEIIITISLLFIYVILRMVYVCVVVCGSSVERRES